MSEVYVVVWRCVLMLGMCVDVCECVYEVMDVLDVSGWMYAML